jgi:hypothetical protein
MRKRGKQRSVEGDQRTILHDCWILLRFLPWGVGEEVLDRFGRSGGLNRFV